MASPKPYTLRTRHVSANTTHYTLFTTHYTLFTFHYSLLNTHHSLFITHYTLFTIYYSLHFSQFTTRYTLILGQFNRYIFGVVGMASGCGFCFLPDTSGRKSKKIVAPVAATRPMTGITGGVVDELEALQEGYGETLKRNVSVRFLASRTHSSFIATVRYDEPWSAHCSNFCKLLSNHYTRRDPFQPGVPGV